MRSKGGYTLLEVLVALILLVAIVAPSALWLERNRTNQLARRQFLVLQVLDSTLATLLAEGDTVEFRRPMSNPMPGTLEHTVEAYRNLYIHHLRYSTRDSLTSLTLVGSHTAP